MTPQQASQNYYWIKYNPKTNEIDMFMDHQMLSTKRQCESKFYIEHILNIRPRGHKAWSLTFGAWMHFCFEIFYTSIKDSPNGTPIEVEKWLQYAVEKWRELNLEAYNGEDKFQDIGGWPGAASLLVQYYTFYMEQRLRVVACEIPFGLEKEVYLGSFEACVVNSREETIINCYLTGRIDMLVDNGYIIGPVDHKHTHLFRGDEHTKFNPQDGITGYIYATDRIIKKYFPEYEKHVSVGWIHHIQGKPQSIERKTGALRPRFKVSRIDKTELQLQEYAQRQLTTFKDIASIIFLDRTPEWSTTSCHNIYNKDCEYTKIHEQDSVQWPYIISQFYHITEPWNPQKPEQSLMQRDDVISAQQQSVKEKEAKLEVK